MLINCVKRLRRFREFFANNAYVYSTVTTVEQIVAPPLTKIPETHYRTSESNTDNHSQQHVGKFYTIPDDEKKQLFTHGGFPKKFQLQVKTFAEACLMVRSPALELMHYMRTTDFSRPVVRFVLYGENGVGKTLTMAHILHYGLQNDYLLVHVPWAPNWMKRPKELVTSSSHEGYTDLPFDAAAWLVHFKTQNGKLLSKSELRTGQDYFWSKREVTPSGSVLSDLVEHGISRIKFASGVIAALVTEIKRLSTEGHCKTLVVIDGYNAFFHPITRLYGERKVMITPDKITLTKPFLNLTNYDWTHGVCVLSVDKIAMTEGYMDSYMPRYLLGEGFEHLDPFVPISVDKFNDKEFSACINYYLDRQWIQKAPPGFDEQLKYMSSRNPYTLMQLTRSL